MLFKNKYIKFIDIIFLLLSFIFLLLLSLFLRKNLSLNELLFINLSFILIIFVILQIYRKIINKFNLELNKLSGEILISGLHLNIPPVFTEWTIDSDLLKIIIDDIYNKKYNINILELGTGLSTIVLSKILNKLNNGKLYSIENDRIFYEKTKKLLELNKLDNICDLFFSPLEDVYINGIKWTWYNIYFLSKVNNIDILIIDGPPAYIQKMSRFPALPILIDKLNYNISIYLDDGNREDEKKIIREWKNLYKELNFEFINTFKGAWYICYENKFKNN